MDNENETTDSSNGELETTDSETSETAEADAPQKEKELSEKNKQLFERAKKSETEVKELREQLKKLTPDKELEKSQSSEPDYARLAYLETKGINHPDDQKWVQDEAARLKLPLTDILNMAHAKVQLETAKTQREALAGMPKGRGNASGKTQQDVDYWLAKGETPDDLEMAEKVIDARLKKEKMKNTFSDELYTG